MLDRTMGAQIGAWELKSKPGNSNRDLAAQIEPWKPGSSNRTMVAKIEPLDLRIELLWYNTILISFARRLSYNTILTGVGWAPPYNTILTCFYLGISCSFILYVLRLSRLDVFSRLNMTAAHLFSSKIKCAHVTMRRENTSHYFRAMCII